MFRCTSVILRIILASYAFFFACLFSLLFFAAFCFGSRIKKVNAAFFVCDFNLILFLCYIFLMDLSKKKMELMCIGEGLLF